MLASSAISKRLFPPSKKRQLIAVSSQEVEIWQADVGQRWAVGPAQASERKDALAGGKRGAARWRHPAGTAADDTMGARPSSDSCRPSSKQREDGKAVRSALMQQPGRLSLDSCYDGSTLEDLCCSPLSEDGFSPLSQDGLIQQDDALALTAFSDSSAWHVEAGFSATSADDALQGQRFVSEPEVRPPGPGPPAAATTLPEMPTSSLPEMPIAAVAVAAAAAECTAAPSTTAAAELRRVPLLCLGCCRMSQLRWGRCSWAASLGAAHAP